MCLCLAVTFCAHPELIPTETISPGARPLSTAAAPSVRPSTTCRISTGHRADACPPCGDHSGLMVFTLVSGVTMRDQAPELLLLFRGQHLPNILHQREMCQPEGRLF